MAGKVYGLFVGINYPGTSAELSGCVNDANDWYGYFSQDLTESWTLVDADATKKNIIAGLEACISRMKYRDRLLFTYSGHGSWVPDMNDDESDGRDEVLCPIDYQNGMLLDDELDAIFSKKAYGSQIIFLSDSCHSGSVYKLIGNPRYQDGREESSDKRIRFLPPDNFLEGRKGKRAAEIVERIVTGNAKGRIPKKDKPKSGVITISGCLDHEYSYDAWFESKANGAFTYHMLKVFRDAPKGSTYEHLMSMMNAFLPSYQYPQTPRLGATTTYARKVALSKE